MALTVRLAGFNLDAEIIQEVLDILRALDLEGAALCRSDSSAAEYRQFLERLIDSAQSALPQDSFTPETLSAAYARISRDPKPVSDLRRAARFGIVRARKSNENIIFGLGHNSVAEHACFNFDITGLSRLAAEELQSHRLVSFTEKSQRYISLATDFVVPEELQDSPWATRFRESIPALFAEYQQLCDTLAASSGSPSTKEAESKAKEDARYLLPLACTTQMGMTINARNIELIARDLSDHPLIELRQLGRQLRDAAAGLAPSLVKYTSRGGYPRGNRSRLAELFPPHAAPVTDFVSEPDVRLTDSTPDGERRILQALAFRCGADSHAVNEAPEQIWREVFRDMTCHDSTLREFELAALTFEVQISASCFAQLKRHRMMTLIHQPYRLADGLVVPPSIQGAGLDGTYRAVVARYMNTVRDLFVEHPDVAPYLLLNGQRRRVLIHLNVRELYHFTRLRCDAHAQWEIRLLADRMLDQARAIWPYALALAGGKDSFAAAHARLFA